MKKIVLFITIIGFSLTAKAQDTASINWMTIEEAMAAQKKEPRKIIMDMYTNWCGPCKMLDKYTFQNKDVAAYVNKNFYAVKFNAEGNKEVLFLGKKFSNPNYDATKKNRRKVTTKESWEKYQKEFKSTFSD